MKTFSFIGTLCVLTALLAVLSPLAMAAPQPPQRVEVQVTSDGFVPALITVKAESQVTLVVTRKVERTCATDIVIKDLGIRKALPLNVPVEVTFTPKSPGRIRFSCGMDMISGVIVVESRRIR